MTELLVWHFLPSDGRLTHEGTLVVPGQTLRLPEGAAPAICAVGYHGSIKALDALLLALGRSPNRPPSDSPAPPHSLPRQEGGRRNVR